MIDDRIYTMKAICFSNTPCSCIHYHCRYGMRGEVKDNAVDLFTDVSASQSTEITNYLY